MSKRLVIIIAICLLLQASSFAQDPLDVRRPMLDAKTSNASNIQPLTSNAQDKPQLKGYGYNLKRLLEQAEANIQKAKKELENLEIRQRNEHREAKVIEHFERGNQLYQAGNLKQAQLEWQRALEFSQNPEMKDYIKESEKRAREEEIVRKKEEQQRQRKLAAETKERERLEKERHIEIELEKNEQERKAKERQARLEKEKKQVELVGKREEEERQKRLKAEVREEERKQKEDELAKKKAEAERQKQIAAEKREEESAEKKSKQEAIRQEILRQTEIKKQQKK